MADFFREVEEDVRRDQLIQFWQKYQLWIIAAAFLIVAGTAAWRVYAHFQRVADEAAGDRYEAALQLAQDGKDAAAAAAFKTIAEGGAGGYATLAGLARANALATKEPEAAAKAYDAVAANSAVDPAYRNVARLRSAYLRVDTESPKEFAQQYGAYAGPDSPYRNAYRELLALADVKGSDYAGASHWLEMAAADPSSPPNLRARADAFLSIVQAGPVPTK